VKNTQIILLQYFITTYATVDDANNAGTNHNVLKNPAGFAPSMYEIIYVATSNKEYVMDGIINPIIRPVKKSFNFVSGFRKIPVIKKNIGRWYKYTALEIGVGNI
jgi:hypothetical protein